MHRGDKMEETTLQLLDFAETKLEETDHDYSAKKYETDIKSEGFLENYIDEPENLPGYNELRYEEDIEMNNDSGNIEDEIHTVKCTTCKMNFINNVQLNIHNMVHQKCDKFFCCDICKRKIQNKYKFEEHIQKHMCLKPFVCGHCNERFSSSKDTKIHMQTHTNRPFSCNLCEKCFTSKGSLMAHKIMHMPSNKFKCKFCRIDFPSKLSLQLHVSKFHDMVKSYRNLSLPGIAGNGFKCTHCDKIYMSKSSLKVHNLSHATRVQKIVVVK
ncbi:unnamed protein product [Brassicogethes aeneus]|uniref:C2H2-type domain-containing protein n=1 Tax=Brassicogethes aeneus TaxID=1431903 RepID=A0A9P0BJX6_BRAAE|nr:unnamed protein product [Brassicogethes aeneus]